MKKNCETFKIKFLSKLTLSTDYISVQWFTKTLFIPEFQIFWNVMPLPFINYIKRHTHLFPKKTKKFGI